MLADILIQQVRTPNNQQQPRFRKGVTETGTEQRVAIGRQLVLRDIVLIISECCIDAGVNAIPAAVQADSQPLWRNPRQVGAGGILLAVHVIGKQANMKVTAFVVENFDQRLRFSTRKFDISLVKIGYIRTVIDIIRNTV